MKQNRSNQFVTPWLRLQVTCKGRYWKSFYPNLFQQVKIFNDILCDQNSIQTWSQMDVKSNFYDFYILQWINLNRMQNDYKFQVEKNAVVVAELPDLYFIRWGVDDTVRKACNNQYTGLVSFLCQISTTNGSCFATFNINLCVLGISHYWIRFWSTVSWLTI